jgi:PAS domain S-box-containing protein
MADQSSSITNPSQALDLLLAQSANAILQLEQDGTILMAQGGALTWLAGQPLIGRKLSELAQDPQGVGVLLTQAASGEIAIGRIHVRNDSANYRVDAATGTLNNSDIRPIGDRWWHVRCQASGNSFTVAVDDQTEEIAATQARGEVLSGIRAILWHADIAFEAGEVRWNLRLDNEEMGPAFLPLTLEEGQSWGQAWVASRHPEDAERMNKTSSDALISGVDRYNQVFRCYDADGNIHYLLEDVQVQQLAPMRWRLVGICTNVTELQHQAQRLSQFDVLVRNALDGILICDTLGNVVFSNPAIRRYLGYSSQEELLGTFAVDLLAPQDHQLLVDTIAPQLAAGWRGQLRLQCVDGSILHTQAAAFLLTDQNGADIGSALIMSDLTEQRRLEAEREQLQQDVITAQQAALRELSTPLIPLADGLVALPLIGAIDIARAEQIMETLLEGIARMQAETAIIDITGVKVIDTQVADVLLRVARAAQLLGARVIVTGMSAAIAQSFVQMGAEIPGIVTLANLQAGLAYAMKH